MVGYIILGLTLAGFIGIGVGALVMRLRLHWPDKDVYTRATATHRGYKATVLLPRTFAATAAQRKDMAKRCAIANYTLRMVWEWPEESKLRVARLDSVLSWTVAWFKEPREFDKDVMSWRAGASYLKAQAYATRISSRTKGGGLPTGVIRIKHLKMVQDTGQPYGHEMTHHLMQELLGMSDRAHENDAMWQDFRKRFVARYLIELGKYGDLMRVGE
jgi:hypothetical protein